MTIMLIKTKILHNNMSHLLAIVQCRSGRLYWVLLLLVQVCLVFFQQGLVQKWTKPEKFNSFTATFDNNRRLQTAYILMRRSLWAVLSGSTLFDIQSFSFLYNFFSIDSLLIKNKADDIVVWNLAPKEFKQINLRQWIMKWKGPYHRT